MKANKYKEKIDNLTKRKEELQEEINTIDDKKLTLIHKHLYKTRKEFVGRYFKTNPPGLNKLPEYYKVLEFTKDNAFLVEKFQLSPTMYFKIFTLEKTIIPIYWLSENLEITEDEYNTKKKSLFKEVEDAKMEEMG